MSRRLVGDDVARVGEMDGPGERRGARFQSDRTRHARGTVKGRLEVASEIVMLERSREQDGNINRRLDAHRPERTMTPPVANHGTSMIHQS
jgi:hypothetical protein